MYNLPKWSNVQNVTMWKHLTLLVTSIEQIINTTVPINNQKRLIIPVVMCSS